MKEILQGKLIVRPGNATINGKKALLVFGVLSYSGDIESIEDSDEMWVVDLDINDIIKFGKPENKQSPTWNFSPEDILGVWGDCTSTKKWQRK